MHMLFIFSVCMHKKCTAMHERCRVIVKQRPMPHYKSANCQAVLNTGECGHANGCGVLTPSDHHDSTLGSNPHFKPLLSLGMNCLLFFAIIRERVWMGDRKWGCSLGWEGWARTGDYSKGWGLSNGGGANPSCAGGFPCLNLLIKC